MVERVPAELFPAGHFIKREIESRGWTQADLAEIMGGVSRPHLNEILVGKRGISPEMARALGAAFGTSAELWMNLDTAYQLWKTQTQVSDVKKRAVLYGKAPIASMIKRGWIEGSQNVDVLEQQVLAFFEINSLEDEPDVLPYAARQSRYGEEPSPLHKAYLKQAAHIAQKMIVRPFSQSSLKQALTRLRALIHAPDEVRHVPRILAEAGIRFVVMEPLPQMTRFDGATFWLENKHPVVVLTFRFDRIDWFWHTLMHELGHVKNGDAAFDRLYGENGEVTEGKPPTELAADEFAVGFLVPQDELKDFIARKRPVYRLLDIQGFANRIGVHAGIVLGQLQYRRELPYSSFTALKEKVRHLVLPAATSDGFGQKITTLAGVMS